MIQREVFQSNLHLESQRNKESRNLDSGISLLVHTFVIEESSSAGAAVNGVDLFVLVRVHIFGSLLDDQGIDKTEVTDCGLSDDASAFVFSRDWDPFMIPCYTP